MLLFKIVSNLEYVKPHSETIKLVKIDSLRLITYRKYKASNYYKKKLIRKSLIKPFFFLTDLSPKKCLLHLRVTCYYHQRKTPFCQLKDIKQFIKLSLYYLVYILRNKFLINLNTKQTHFIIIYFTSYGSPLRAYIKKNKCKVSQIN